MSWWGELEAKLLFLLFSNQLLESNRPCYHSKSKIGSSMFIPTACGAKVRESSRWFKTLIVGIWSQGITERFPWGFLLWGVSMDKLCGPSSLQDGAPSSLCWFLIRYIPIRRLVIDVIVGNHSLAIWMLIPYVSWWWLWAKHGQHRRKSLLWIWNPGK